MSPPVCDSDKFKALNVQHGSVRLNVVCSLDLITLLVNKLTEDIYLKNRSTAPNKSSSKIFKTR